MEARLSVIVALALAQVAMGCSRPSNEREISSGEYGKKWPFSVERGILSCENNEVLFTANGTTYGVNGTAKGRGRPGIEAIWKKESIDGRVVVLDRLPEDQRQTIFLLTVACEDSGEREAERRTTDARKQVELSRELSDACKTQLRSQHKLTPDDARQISNEGLAKSWPPLSPRRVNIGPIIDDGLRLCGER